MKLAYNALDSQDKQRARSTIRQADILVNAPGFVRDHLFFDIDKDWCQIGKALPSFYQFAYNSNNRAA